MSSPALFAARIQSGAASPVTIDNTFDFRGFTAGQPLFFGFYYRADRITGTNVDILTSKIRWWDNAGTELTATTAAISVDASTSGFVFFESAHIAPTNAVRGRVNFTGTAGGTTFQHTIYVTAIRVAKTEAFAQVTRWVEGPTQRTTFSYDYTGAAQTGEFPRDITFKLMDTAGQITSGITWSYLLLSGTVNGFTSADGSKSMTGTGTGTMTVSSLGSSTAKVQITALYAGQSYTYVVGYSQDTSAPPIGGGSGSNVIASKTSGFAGFSTTTFTDQGAVTGTVPAGVTSVTVNVDLDAMPVASSTSSGSWNIEAEVTRDISGTPTQIGTTQTGYSTQWFAGDFSGNDAQITFGISDTGLTAGTTYTWRVFLRITSGTKSHTVTGQVSVTA